MRKLKKLKPHRLNFGVPVTDEATAVIKDETTAVIKDEITAVIKGETTAVTKDEATAVSKDEAAAVTQSGGIIVVTAHNNGAVTLVQITGIAASQTGSNAVELIKNYLLN